MRVFLDTEFIEAGCNLGFDTVCEKGLRYEIKRAAPHALQPIPPVEFYSEASG